VGRFQLLLEEDGGGRQLARDPVVPMGEGPGVRVALAVGRERLDSRAAIARAGEPGEVVEGVPISTEKKTRVAKLP
jgi:hypothetical protein